MHELSTNNTLKKHPLSHSSHTHFSQSLLQTWKHNLYSPTFVDTSDRDITLKQRLMNIAVESGNKNYMSLRKPSVFEIKSSIESKIVIWKLDFESAIDVSIYTANYIGKIVYISESENKNYKSLRRPSVFEIKWSIESKIVIWKVDFESAIDVSTYTPTSIGKIVYIFAHF